MKRTQYVEELKTMLLECCGGKTHINIGQIAKALGVSISTASRFVFNVKYIPNGKEKLFFVNDVAMALYNITQCDGIGGALID